MKNELEFLEKKDFVCEAKFGTSNFKNCLNCQHYQFGCFAERLKRELKKECEEQNCINFFKNYKCPNCNGEIMFMEIDAYWCPTCHEGIKISNAKIRNTLGHNYKYFDEESYEKLTNLLYAKYADEDCIICKNRKYGSLCQSCLKKVSTTKTKIIKLLNQDTPLANLDNNSKKIFSIALNQAVDEISYNLIPNTEK